MRELFAYLDWLLFVAFFLAFGWLGAAILDVINGIQSGQAY